MNADTPGGVELRAGALRLALRPDLGGCIAGLWHGEMPVLRSTQPALLAKVRAAGAFPLVPYSNRLGYRRFRWAGRDYTTAPNFDDSPHSLHGVGWRRPWDIVSSTDSEVVLRCCHEPDADWPFAFEAMQTFTLQPDALQVGMTVTNRAPLAQPVGLGWHPYFPKRERSRLRIDCDARWDSDATLLPVRKVAQHGIDADVRHLDFDNCFDGWRGAARIRDECFALQLTASFAHVVVYTPQHGDHFCVEPVSHVNNAIHMAEPFAHGLRRLEPDESTDGWMRLQVQAL